MLIRSIKIHRPKLLAGMLAAAVIAAIAAVWVFAPHGKPAVRELNSETKRQAFLDEMGWEVGDTFDSAKTVLIPDDWNDVYEQYNNIQLQQGFDLTAYKGRRVDIYTYKIKNYPGHEGEEGIICDLMICDGQLIGGDVCSTALDGFMQGLKCPEESKSPKQDASAKDTESSQ